MAKRKALATQKARLRSPGRRYPGVQGKVVDYISHSIDDGTLCVNVIDVPFWAGRAGGY